MHKEFEYSLSEFKGKKVLVTGGTKGMGQAVVKDLQTPELQSLLLPVQYPLTCPIQ